MAPQIAFISAFLGSLLGGDVVRIPLAWIQKRENVIVTINIGGAGAADALLVAGLSAGVLTSLGVSAVESHMTLSWRQGRKNILKYAMIRNRIRTK